MFPRHFEESDVSTFDVLDRKIEEALNRKLDIVLARLSDKTTTTSAEPQTEN